MFLVLVQKFLCALVSLAPVRPGLVALAVAEDGQVVGGVEGEGQGLLDDLEINYPVWIQRP